MTQLFDGAFTYLGVLKFGPGVEANPLLAYLMHHWGIYGLIFAKVSASVLGIILYLKGIHSVVAFLAGLYLTAAIIPWVIKLFLDPH